MKYTQFDTQAGVPTRIIEVPEEVIEKAGGLRALYLQFRHPQEMHRYDPSHAKTCDDFGEEMETPIVRVTIGDLLFS